MGYSYDNVIEENIVEFSRWAGIAIEHAYGFTIRKNRIHLNGDGIRLFTRGGAVTDYFPNRRVTYNMTIEENDITQNRIGINAYTGDETQEDLCHSLNIQNNQFTENQIGLQLKRVRDSLVSENHFKQTLQSAIQHSESEGLHLENNREDE
jgi:parallel beta-helix repeat protein